MNRPIIFAVAVLALATPPAWAQQNATTVQLPSFSFFTVSTTVSAPAIPVRPVFAGESHFGGTRRVHLGPLFARGQRAQRGPSVRIAAHSHDLLLRPEVRQALLRRESPLAAKIAATHQERGGDSIQSVAAIRRDKQNESDAKQREALAYLEKARAAVSQGKTGLAKVYYQMAARRASGQLKQQVTAQLQRLSRN